MYTAQQLSIDTTKLKARYLREVRQCTEIYRYTAGTCGFNPNIGLYYWRNVRYAWGTANRVQCMAIKGVKSWCQKRIAGVQK